MPIYEYEAVDPRKACRTCAGPFEIIQGMDEPPLTTCPSCGRRVKKVISWCRAAIVETSDEHGRVNKSISEYEKAGMWSHAAELADTHSEKVGNHDLKIRALDDYKKAGYDLGTLEKHAQTKSDLKED
ncbi:MAG: zinc ribbon domain-containing protein [Deltaproteobacteria bacterium]|nr:zinc ribbon domain-containing protein [Deltaproteobacteria bacterium]